VFELILESFHGLEDVRGPMFQRRDAILQSAARVKTCVMLLDLECNDLIEDMFANFFSSVRSETPHCPFLCLACAPRTPPVTTPLVGRIEALSEHEWDIKALMEEVRYHLRKCLIGNVLLSCLLLRRRLM